MTTPKEYRKDDTMSQFNLESEQQDEDLVRQIQREGRVKPKNFKEAMRTVHCKPLLVTRF